MMLDPAELGAVLADERVLYVLPKDRGRLFDVVERTYRTRCPCCLRPMMMKMKTAAHAKMPKTAMTRGHVYNAGNVETRDVWFRQCVECNHDQASLELGIWATYLARRGDHRTANVEALCEIVYRWLDAHGRRIAPDKISWLPSPRLLR